MTALSRPAEPLRNALSFRRAIERLLGRPFAWLAACHETMRQRRALKRLDDRLLRDIGLTRFDVARITGRPFWEP